MMPALYFQPEFLDPLLRSDKQQTTRPQTKRFKVGDIMSIYNQQRKRIQDKPLRRMTEIGQIAMARRILNIPTYPRGSHSQYYAHFLGKVEIDAVYDIHPCEMSGEALKAWALADGFHDFIGLGFRDVELADTWFRARYGTDWMQRWYTVISWRRCGWVERYFEPEAVV
jgi:hypothetical protein